MTPQSTSASPAAPRRLAALATQAFTQACRWTRGAAFGLASIIAVMATRGRPQSPAQAEALSNIAHLQRQKTHLLAEKEILVAERAEAVRRHKRVSSFDARLRAINAELLSIG